MASWAFVPNTATTSHYSRGKRMVLESLQKTNVLTNQSSQAVTASATNLKTCQTLTSHKGDCLDCDEEAKSVRSDGGLSNNDFVPDSEDSESSSIILQFPALASAQRQAVDRASSCIAANSSMCTDSSSTYTDSSSVYIPSSMSMNSSSTCKSSSTTYTYKKTSSKRKKISSCKNSSSVSKPPSSMCKKNSSTSTNPSSISKKNSSTSTNPPSTSKPSSSTSNPPSSTSKPSSSTSNTPSSTSKPSSSTSNTPSSTSKPSSSTSNTPSSTSKPSSSTSNTPTSTFKPSSSTSTNPSSCTNPSSTRQNPSSRSTTASRTSMKKRPHRPCLYCGILQSDVSRHIKRKHKDEEAVQAALRLPKTEKDRAFSNLKKRGIYLTNIKLKDELGDEASFHRERSQGRDQSVPVMCSGCDGFFSKARICEHKKKCQSSTSSNHPPVTVDFLSQNKNVSEKLQREILDHLRRDDIGSVAKTDKVSLLIGEKFLAKSGKDRHAIASDMRTFSRLLLKVREITGNEELTGEDILVNNQFDNLSKAIELLTEKEDKSQKSGQCLTFGNVLKKAVKVLRGYYAKYDMTEKANELEKFQRVLDMEWDFLFYTARMRCELRRNSLRQPEDMPLEHDVKVLREYLLVETETMMNDTFMLWGRHEYIKLRNLLLTRLTMYNARRGGEPARLTIKEWKDAEDGKWIDPELVCNVTDPLEQKLMHNHKLAYQEGKGGRRLVPVLIPNDCIEPLHKLVKIRHDAGVPEGNEFLFANTNQSMDHCMGWNSINAVTSSLGEKLAKPNLLIADKFRHRASTVFALLDIPEAERDVFYRHMGHSMEMNKNVYQCPAAVLEMTKVGGFLESLDVKGKSASVSTWENIERTDGRIATKEMDVEKETDKRGAAGEEMDVEKETDKRGAAGEEMDVEKETDTRGAAGEEMDVEKETDKRGATGDEMDVEKETDTRGAAGKEMDVEKETDTRDTSKVEVYKEKNTNKRGATEINTDMECKKRQYYQWEKHDKALVENHFKHFIRVPGVGSKGSLPSKDTLSTFLATHGQDMFQNAQHLTQNEKIKLIKTQIFNARKKFRANTEFKRY